MRPVRHWTPRYLKNRIALEIWGRRTPNAPWLTRVAVRHLDRYLEPSHVCLEWGSGRSTPWFASRVGHLTSVESDPPWHAQIDRLLSATNVSNVDHRLIEADLLLTFAMATTSSQVSDLHRYAEVAREFEDKSLDFVLIDGAARDLCLVEAIPKIRAGGILALDNANWLFPSDSHSPSSIPPEGEPLTPLCDQALDTLRYWRSRRTTDGVTDTWLWLAP